MYLFKGIDNRVDNSIVCIENIDCINNNINIAIYITVLFFYDSVISVTVKIYYFH